MGKPSSGTGGRSVARRVLTGSDDRPAAEVVVAQGYARGIGSVPQLGSTNTNKQRKLFMASKTSEIIKVGFNLLVPLSWMNRRKLAQCESSNAFSCGVTNSVEN
jgi:hypothetical protein